MKPRPSGTPYVVSLRPLKDFALRELPETHPLRSVILAEKDELGANEFSLKLETWNVLLSLKSG
jgi:hypothetical protein